MEGVELSAMPQKATRKSPKSNVPPGVAVAVMESTRTYIDRTMSIRPNTFAWKM